MNEQFHDAVLTRAVARAHAAALYHGRRMFFYGLITGVLATLLAKL